jgi:hypothetical protein
MLFIFNKILLGGIIFFFIESPIIMSWIILLTLTIFVF